MGLGSSSSSSVHYEKLCLKWIDFQNIVQTSFGELRSHNDFTDVTLACEDESIKVHKVVLSACSPFFKRLLKTHSHPQPLIYMRGIKSTDLVAIVDFIYLGEANIFQEQLDIFLTLAEELELRGSTETQKRLPWIIQRDLLLVIIKECLTLALTGETEMWGLQ